MYFFLEEPFVSHEDGGVLVEASAGEWFCKHVTNAVSGGYEFNADTLSVIHFRSDYLEFSIPVLCPV